jgi:hypothetical protein
MDAKAALLQKLRDAQSSVPGVDPWERKKNEWVDDLEKLVATIEDWLAQARDEGLVAIEKKVIELREEDLGPYDVPTLEIRTRTRHPRTVHVLPRGMRIVGVVGAEPSHRARKASATGRVDLISGASRTILLRAKKGQKTAWEVVLAGGGTVELDEERFLDAFNELIE